MMRQASVSIFLENPHRPRFGFFFDQFTDLHLLVSHMEASTIVEILKDET